MPLIKFEKAPRQYSWNINGYIFQFVVEDWDDENVSARDILIHDLEAVVKELRIMPILTTKKPFELPPLKEDGPLEDKGGKDRKKKGEDKNAS